MASGDIKYADLTEQVRAYLANARKAVESMRRFLVAHRLLSASATVEELVRAAITCESESFLVNRRRSVSPSETSWLGASVGRGCA